MDVNSTFSISNVESRGSKKERKPHSEKTRSQSVKDSDASQYREGEAFAIDGLLAGNLDPKVSMALEHLAGQLEPLRNEVEVAHTREAHFKEISKQHSFMPLLGRREFLRELSLTISHIQTLNGATLIVLYLVNGEEIRQKLGREALDSALNQVSAIINSTLNPTDIVGSMGGNDFGLILLEGDIKIAEHRLQLLADMALSRPFLWLEEKIPLKIVAGKTFLDGGLTPEKALEVADQELLQYLST